MTDNKLKHTSKDSAPIYKLAFGIIQDHIRGRVVVEHHPVVPKNGTLLKEVIIEKLHVPSKDRRMMLQEQPIFEHQLLNEVKHSR